MKFSLRPMALMVPMVLAVCGCATHPTLLQPAAIESGCVPSSLGDTVLYLRGSLSSWAALEEYAFQYRCDGYYLNVEAVANQDFKLADADWTPATSFGAPVGGNGTIGDSVLFALVRGSDPGGNANLRFRFAGEHTVKLVLDQGKATVTIGPKSFDDPRARPVTDPVALSLRFDSRALGHKAPFGAVVAGRQIEFALSALPGVDSATLVIESRLLMGNQEQLDYHELVRIPMTSQAAGAIQRWQASHRFADIGVYGYWFDLVIGGQHYVYQNNRNSVFWTRERGNGGEGLVSFAPESRESIRRYRQTVYRADFVVPEWAPDVIYYYIFPERFRNGDRSNDPEPGVQRFHDGTVEFHTDWNDRPWLNGTGDGSDARYSNDFFGGDIAGIIEKLDYIRELGANTLYLTPLFQAASNHKYDTADYRRVDPGFGSNVDFARLTGEAAKRGIRVIPDTSLNHTGEDSLYFNRYGNHPGIGAFQNGEIRSDSPYADWYRFDPDNAEQPYQGWVGVRDLPELDKQSRSFRDFAYGKPDSVMLHWLDQGAAGWRMDVAPWVPDDFWREWRSAIRAHRPDALTVAETWFDASKFLLGDMFDSTMNYIFRNAVLEYAGGADARQMYGHLEWLREAYPPQALYALMNLLSTHDQARSLHVLGDHGPETDPVTRALAKRRLLLAMLLQMSYPGSPAIFYADEVGVTGGDDPYNRVTYPWADLGGEPDLAMLAQVQTLTRMRREHAVLSRGSLEAPLYLDEHLIVLLRRLGDQVAIVVTNNSESAQALNLPVPPELADIGLHDVVGGQHFEVLGGHLQLSVPALSGMVLVGSR
ncbi:MAG: alpha-amylase family glycosyl hydrolase [Lysobacterales bacterium]